VYSQVADVASVVASSPGSSKSKASHQQNRSNKKTNFFSPPIGRNKYFGAASSPFGKVQHDDTVPSVSPINKAFKEFNFGNTEEDSNISLSDEYDSTFHHHDDGVSINLAETSINRLYHFVNPKVLTCNGERYAICNIKVPPVYCTGNNIEVEVSKMDSKHISTLQNQKLFILQLLFWDSNQETEITISCMQQ
jgi:hypothetical protein